MRQETRRNLPTAEDLKGLQQKWEDRKKALTPNTSTKSPIELLAPLPTKPNERSGLEPLPGSASATILDSQAEGGFLRNGTSQGQDPIAANKVAVVLMRRRDKVCSFRFLKSIPKWAHKLPHHVAREIPYIDREKGITTKTEKPKGIRLEQFVFDVACIEVKREQEFFPLKNTYGTGEDDLDASKKDIMQQGKRWAQIAGATVVART